MHCLISYCSDSMFTEMGTSSIFLHIFKKALTFI